MDARLIFLLVFLSLGIFTEEASESPPMTGRKTARPLSVLLVTVPFAGHAVQCLVMGEALAKRGHNVTLVSAPSDFIRKEIGHYGVSLWSIGEGFMSVEENRLLVQNMSGKNSAYEDRYKAFEVAMDFQRRVLETIDNEAIKSFDLIVGDVDFFVALMCLTRKWNIPGVYVSFSLMNNPLFQHAWPFPVMSNGYTDDLNFFQRLEIVIKVKVSQLLVIGYSVWSSFKKDNICSKISTVEFFHYYNYHPVIVAASIGYEFPRTLLPLIHYVGPMISQYQPQLPQHIEEWLSGRDPKSVVYVSMGSVVSLTSAQAEMIVNGATQANFSVVWSLRKTNQHILEHMTFDRDNVLIADWLPQVTILRHPNIHSAVLHGGTGGIQEALSCGVPILTIPFVLDHSDNAVRVPYHNYGIMLKLHELSTPLVTHTLQVIGTELYRKSLKKVQRIYKKDGGASRAADLIEFYSDVGYEHLIPSYAKYNWTWIEIYNVDVSFVLILALLVTSYLTYQCVCRCCLALCFKRKNKVE